MLRPGLAACALLLPFAAAVPPAVARLADDPPDLSNWPPDRHFDHRSVRLEIDIPDMGTRFLEGVMTLEAEAVGRERGELVLDAAGLDVRSVSVAGRRASHRQDGTRLHVRIEPPFRRGERVAVTVGYSLSPQRADGRGLTWTTGNPAAANLTDRSPQIHTQGQPQSSGMWFPCHDFPNEQIDRLELVVTVDSDYQVCGNGRLAGRDLLPDGRSRWRWVSEQPLSAYLVCMVIGRFTVVDVGGAASARPGIPFTVYTHAGTGERAVQVFRRTPEMMAFFEDIFDEPYPFDKYAQALVRGFAAGAMENTTLVTFSADALGWGEFAESVIAHELAHHWFGNMVFYKSWEHLWLGEGWATYAEALWAEHLRGPRAYQRSIRGQMTQQGHNTSRAPEAAPLASNRYVRADEAFFKVNNPYSRGAAVLHMLRMRLGDEVFFRGVRLFIDRYRFRAAETDDFRRVMEEVSGDSLERFFRQWVRQPGAPQVEIDLAWEGGGELRVRARQTQPVDGDNPAFAFEIPLLVKGASGASWFVYLPMDSIEASAAFELDEEPVDVVVDPGMSVLMRSRVTKPLAMWAEQALRGPTYAARSQAVEHLAQMPLPAAGRLLLRAAIAADTPADVRAAAVAAVAGRAWRRVAADGAAHIATFAGAGAAPAPGGD
jgi:aminopeptidase N